MYNSKKRIAVVGCGSIGTEIAKSIDSGYINGVITGIFDSDSDAAKSLSAGLDSKPEILDLEKLAEISDIIVEAASVNAIEPLVEICIKKSIDLIIMSVGGLKEEHFKAFEASESNLYIPSGAIGGIDSILAYSACNIDSISLTTKKPPKGLEGAPYLVNNNISIENLQEAKVVFEGTPWDAIKAFPKNINVSTTLSLASRCGSKLKVKVIADPFVTVNTHEIELKSDDGNVFARFENKPSTNNPKTSGLAYLSAIATLKKITSRVKIGT